MVTAEDVRTYITQAGPVLPKHIAEAFGISTLFASAFLSELSSDNRILTSHLKIGGSPLYYTVGHRDRLVDYRGNLHEKEQKTFELLRSEKILDDSALELLDRVALRKMEDFAVPLAVDVEGTRRIFWKYYLFSDEESVKLIGAIIEAERASRTTEPIESAPAEQIVPPAGSVLVDAPAEISYPEQPPPAPASGVPEPADDDAGDGIDEPAAETVDASGAAEESAPRTAPRERQSRISRAPQRVTVTRTPEASEALASDQLAKRIIEYFAQKGIRILFAEVPRKNTCLGVCSVPSNIGELEYYFYAKDKKSITDKDIKEAFAESAILGYPLLYLAKGDVKKSANELIGSKIKGSIIIEL